jgi:hypothetical protein
MGKVKNRKNMPLGMKWVLLKALILVSMWVSASNEDDSRKTFSLSEASRSSLAHKAVVEFQRLQTINRQNDVVGKSYLNEYIISLDTKNWIEERGSAPLLSENLDLLKTILHEFNTKRQDKLRFYVVVVNDYLATLKGGIGLDRLPAGWTKLSKLEGLVQNDEESGFEEFQKEFASIPAAISDAMTKAGYDERAVYFCARMRVFDLGGPEDQPESTSYLFDALRLEGGRLQSNASIIRNRVRASTDPGNRNFTARIQDAIVNIKTNIEMVIDNGLTESDRDARCKMLSLEQAIANTQLSREASVEVERFSAFMRSPEARQKIVSENVLMDDIGNFAEKGYFIDEVLPDKVSLFNKDFSTYKLRVIYKEIPYAMPVGDWVKLAKDVHSSVGLSSNTILITVPYYKMDCEYLNGFGGTTIQKDLLLMPSAWCPQADAAMLASINSIFSTFAKDTEGSYVLKRWEGAFNQAFSKIPKDYRTFNYSVLWNGDIISQKEQGVTHKGLVGLTELVEINLKIDSRFHEYVKLVLRDKTDCNANGLAASLLGGEDFINYVKCHQPFQENVAALLSKPQDLKPFSTKSNLKQGLLTPDLAKSYVQWIVSRDIFIEGKHSFAPDDDKFYGGRNSVHIKDVLEIIDGFSTVASLVQLDFITDGIGAYYAATNGEYAEAAIYAASTALPISAATYKALQKGEEMLLKRLKGEFTTVSIDIARTVNRGSKAALAVGEVTMAMVHNPEAIEAVLKHVDDNRFLAFFEDELLKADKQTLEALNGSPGLVDEFYHYQNWNDGKGLKEFFDERKVFEGLPDPVEVKKFRDAPGISVAALGRDDAIRDALSRIKHEDGWFDVLVHGNPDSFGVLRNGEWLYFSHRSLYVWLRKQPGFLEAIRKGKGIRLLSCEAGAKELAENLSKKAGARVKAPNIKIVVERNGTVAGLETGGHWAEFDGNNWSIKFEETLDHIPNNNKIPRGSADGAGTSLAISGNIADDFAKVVDDFALQKSDDIIKQTILKRRSDQQFVKEVFVDKSTSEGLIRSSKRDYKTPFKNTKVDRSSLPEHARYKDVIYYNEVEKLKYEAKIKNGLWYVDGKLPSQDKVYIFVMDKKGNIYLAEGVQGKIHHTSFVNGEDVVLAGTMDFREGKLIGMDNISGHYLPGGDDLEVGIGEFLREMGYRGVDVKNTNYRVLDDVIPTPGKGVSPQIVDAIKHTRFEKEIEAFRKTNPDPFLLKMVEDAKSNNDMDLLDDLLKPKSTSNLEVGSSGREYAKSCRVSKDQLAWDKANNIYYVPDNELYKYEVKVKNGKLYVNGDRLDEGATYLFVMDGDGKIYVKLDNGKSLDGLEDLKLKHSSLLSGREVAVAGNIEIDGGLIYINNFSGHYAPENDTLELIIREMTSRGVGIDSFDKIATKIK